MAEGAVARTLPSMPVMAAPGPGLPIVDLGRTRVIVPSAFALLAASRLPMVVKTRDAPWNTPVVPYVKLDAASKDRKSTRLNSSHDQISYAVFCLKKKK